MASTSAVAKGMQQVARATPSRRAVMATGAVGEEMGMRSTRQRSGWYKKRDQRSWVSGKPYLGEKRLGQPRKSQSSVCCTQAESS